MTEEKEPLHELKQELLGFTDEGDEPTPPDGLSTEDEDSTADESGIDAEDTETDTLATSDDNEGEAGDTETDTADDGEATPDAEILKRLGLENYASVEAALAGVKEKDRHINHLADQANNLKDIIQSRFAERQQQAPPKELSPDAFVEQLQTDPVAALRSVGVVTREDMGQLNYRLALGERQLEVGTIANAVGQYEELKDVSDHFRGPALQRDGSIRPPAEGTNPLWDAMQREYTANPGYQRMAHTEAIPILYQVVKSKVKPSPVAEVSAADKAKANSTGKSRSAKRRQMTKKDYDDMSERELAIHLNAQGIRVPIPD